MFCCTPAVSESENEVLRILSGEVKWSHEVAITNSEKRVIIVFMIEAVELVAALTVGS